MKLLRRSDLPKMASLLMLFAAPAFAAEDTQVSSVQAPVEDDKCSVCGPAPCCVVLWTAWCGCPFASTASVENEASAEELLACAPQSQPQTAPEQSQSL
ncbi:hypothetical protein HRD49_04935 [Corallococcus exiguus]|uniref:hypothetical protein n=1 Tax=Corallococcus TaxID=83461 RepID=UPI000ED7A563|nr:MULTISPECIES: hypothetical protein [Corallococcus]NNC17900.1 hypothetical protein [Corallococcus exiguus]NRD54713.1 hypothetical protein [Corallococcus exiguus]NRD61088.1 hypothetical protein [Corallococcus exiguus]RKI08707.1 hypothetical protein D7Y15_25430 [Corallococcus sp. AB030]RUO92783.1 hypothetical protein D7Y11_13075 [Corallococcus sp. AB018]